LECVGRLSEWPVITNDYVSIRLEIQLSDSAQLSFWDSLILVAASRARATRLYTEDLQHGQVVRGIEIVNPFRSATGPLA